MGLVFYGDFVTLTVRLIKALNYYFRLLNLGFIFSLWVKKWYYYF